jgi:hypothetical protein
METDTTTTRTTKAPVAQMVERLPRKQRVVSSSLTGSSNFKGVSFNGRIIGLHPIDAGSNPAMSTIERAANIAAVV